MGVQSRGSASLDVLIVRLTRSTVWVGEEEEEGGGMEQPTKHRRTNERGPEEIESAC